MIDEKKLEKLIKNLKENPDCFWRYDEQFSTPFLEAVEDDRKSLEQYLSNMEVEELAVISRVFQDIYAKWTDEKMWQYLDGLEEKLIDAGYKP